MSSKASPTLQGRPVVKGFYEKRTGSVQYVVADAETKKCAIIDPVLDFDPKSGRASATSADAIATFVRDKGLACEWILETHAHADHLSAAPWLPAQSLAEMRTEMGFASGQTARTAR